MRAKRAVPAPGFETHIEVLPPWLPPDAWDAWCQHRTRKARKMWTRGAAEYSIRELAKAVAQGDDAREIIERSIGSGWTGLFPSKNPRQATTMLDLTIQRQMERRAQPQEHYDDE